MGRHIPYNGGRTKILPEPDWKLILVVSADNTILGMHGLREDAIKQLHKLTKTIPLTSIHLRERVYPFKKRPSVGDQIQ